MSILRKFNRENSEHELKKMDDIRTVGVVYDANLDHRVLNRIVHFFTSEGKEVHTLGFVNAKEVGEEHSASENEHYYCLKDMRFWKVPKKNKLTKFFNSDYDYLINLDTKGRIEMQAVSTFSNAKTRIGKHFEDYPFAQDLMIKSVSTAEEDLFTEITNFIR